jgi:hypothetical protein
MTLASRPPGGPSRNGYCQRPPAVPAGLVTGPLAIAQGVSYFDSGAFLADLSAG